MLGAKNDFVGSQQGEPMIWICVAVAYLYSWNSS